MEISALGRIGGFAVALGIGLSAGCPGAAWAVPEDTSSPDTASAADQPSRPSPERTRRGSRTHADTGAQSPGPSRRGQSSARDPISVPDSGDPGGLTAAPVTPKPAAAEAEKVPTDDVAAVLRAPIAAAIADSLQAVAAKPVTITPSPAAAVPVLTSPAPVPQQASPAMRATPVVGRVVESAIGPLFDANGVAPLEAPVSWVVLAAARRELETAVPVTAPPAAAVTTGQALPAPAAVKTPAPAKAVTTNQPPVIAKVVVGTPNTSSGAVTGTVTASDPNGDKLTYKASTSTKGTVTVTSGGVFTYTPTATARHAAAKLGATTAATTDAVTVVVTDAKGATATSTVTVPISPKNATPVVSAKTGATNAGTGVVTATVTATDADKDALTYSAPASTAKGTVTINPGTGALTYTPTAAARNTAAGAYATNADKTDTVTVTVADGYGGSVAVPVALAVSPKSYVTFAFKYGTGSQYWTPESRAALELAAAKVASYLLAKGPTTITYDVTANSSPLSTNLAWATSDLTKTSDGFYATVVQTKIQTGVDTNGEAADGVVNVNLGKNWGFGNSVDSKRYDFTATLMHEFVHTLGFITFADQAGKNNGTIWTKFDSFLATSNKTKVINPVTLRWNPLYNANLTGGNGGLYFSGPNAVAAYGGPVPLYTPGTWAAGSSVNHLNDVVFSGTKKRLLTAIVSTGQGLRVLSPVELAVLKDLGYTVVPVPGTAAVILVGVMFLRRRRDN